MWRARLLCPFPQPPAPGPGPGPGSACGSSPLLPLVTAGLLVSERRKAELVLMETPLFYFGLSHISPPCLDRRMLIFLFDVDKEAWSLGNAKWVGYEDVALWLPALKIRARFPSCSPAHRRSSPQTRTSSLAQGHPWQPPGPAVSRRGGGAQKEPWQTGFSAPLVVTSRKYGFPSPGFLKLKIALQFTTLIRTIIFLDNYSFLATPEPSS